jgi:hypothetical protein
MLQERQDGYGSCSGTRSTLANSYVLCRSTMLRLNSTWCGCRRRFVVMNFQRAPRPMKDTVAIERIEEYLGAKCSRPFQDAILECQESVLITAKERRRLLTRERGWLNRPVCVLIIAPYLGGTVNSQAHRGIRFEMAKANNACANRLMAAIWQR